MKFIEIIFEILLSAYIRTSTISVHVTLFMLSQLPQNPSKNMSSPDIEVPTTWKSFWVIVVDDERFNTTAVVIFSWKDYLKNSHVDIAPL